MITENVKYDVEEFLEPIDDDLYYQALRFLVQRYPTATWEITRFPDKQGRSVIPYLKTETGYFVEVSIMVEGICRSQMLAVLDENNQVIIEGATAQEIQYAIQDCFLVCVGLHGLRPALTSFIESEGKPTPLPANQSESTSSQEQAPPSIGATEGSNLYQFPLSEASNSYPSHEPPLESSLQGSEQDEKLFSFLDLQACQGDRGPYYMLKLEKNQRVFEVALSGDLMNVLEESDIRVGELCEIEASFVNTPAKGKMYLATSFKKVG